MNTHTVLLAVALQIVFTTNIKASELEKMVKITNGTFIMGGTDYSGRYTKPKHKVSLDAFFMDKYEVTQGEYKKLMGENPCATKERLELTEKMKNKNFKSNEPIKPVGDKYPADSISWYDAVKYCNARSKAEGLEACYDEKTWECDFTKNGYRLPTEAEWEYACRAGTDTRYFFGDDKKKLHEYANYWPEQLKELQMRFEADVNGVPFVWKGDYPSLLPVGSKKPNKWGLYDMLGNAWEWCNDWFGSDYYEKSPEYNPRGPEKCEDDEGRIKRGCSFNFSGATCAYRGRSMPQNKYAGFRCVRNAPKEDKDKDDENYNKKEKSEKSDKEEAPE